MNRLTIIGNLTRDGELRTTPTGKNVFTFTVAVNRRRRTEGQPDADFFNVSVWNDLAVSCSKYLSKGRKVAVVGSISLRTYQRNDGTAGASMEVLANDVEFLSPKETAQVPVKTDQQSGFMQVDEDGLPF